MINCFHEGSHAVVACCEKAVVSDMTSWGCAIDLEEDNPKQMARIFAAGYLGQFRAQQMDHPAERLLETLQHVPTNDDGLQLMVDDYRRLAWLDHHFELDLAAEIHYTDRLVSR